MLAPMSILEDIRLGREQLTKPHLCTVCAWLEGQDRQLIDEFESWIHDGLSREKLLTILQPHGLKVQASTFRKHVRECMLNRG